MMSLPRFSPDQLILTLIIAFAVGALAVWRYFTMF